MDPEPHHAVGRRTGEVKRIVILGCPGSGKSTLARRLGALLDLPVIHIDALYYLPGWAPSPTRAFQARVADAIAGEAWITEGGFLAETAALRLPRADAIVWIDQPVWRCLARALARCLAPRGEGRPDLAPGCRDQIDWALIRDITGFERRDRPRMEAALRALAPLVPLHRLSGDEGIEAFMHSLQRDQERRR
jgi:adenylate kinase family enzyme